MSTIVCLKDGESLVLATDSRIMGPDFSAPVSDSEQKIYEFAPGTFIATAGWLMPCHFQVDTARRLARELNTTDLQVLSDALERESLHYLDKFIDLLASASNLPRVDEALSGAKILHVCLVAGRLSSGELGYSVRTFRVSGHRVTVFREDYSGNQRQIFCSSGDFVHDLVHDPTIFTDNPTKVVQGFLSKLRIASRFIGGPDQIVRLDNHGVHWVSAPPAPTYGVAAGLTAQTALFNGTATFAYATTGPYVQIGSAGAVLGDDYTSPTTTVTINSTGFTAAHGSSSVQITASGVGIYGPSGSLTASSGGIVISNGTSSVTVTSSAVTIINGSLTSPTITGGTLTISNGTVTVNIDGSNYVKVSDSSLLSNSQITSSAVGVAYNDGSAAAQLQVTGGHGGTGYGSLALSAGTTPIGAATAIVVLPATVTGAGSGGSCTLPANPTGFEVHKIGGVYRYVPFY
jgi:hypothetical protein